MAEQAINPNAREVKTGGKVAKKKAQTKITSYA